MTKIQIVILVLYMKFSNQIFMICHAIGTDNIKETITSFAKSLLISQTISSIYAPFTFLIPISFTLLSAINEAVLDILTLDVIKSTEIKGEILNPDQVRSSIARRLGMDIAGSVESCRNVNGPVDMMIDAIHNFLKPLTAEILISFYLFKTCK